MDQNRLFIDYDLCFGCYACEMACKQENQLPVGPKWISVKTVGPKKAAGKLAMNFIPMTCRHCSNPPCIPGCPEEAITKRNDGVVLIARELCIGCLACIEVCPFGAPQFNAELEIVEKCHLCHHRLDRGLQPACVQVCPAGAILYGDMNDITENLRQRRAARLLNI